MKNFKTIKWALISMAFYGTQLSAQKVEDLVPTPPMGWNSWNTFHTNIDEKMVMETADALVSSGMRDAGYVYLVLDDGWMAMERDREGNLVPDPKKFPRGMKFVADYVHSKGLKFGMYNCAGTLTCQKYPGTRGYEYQDARNYASWDIDFLKYDWCNTAGINAKEAYTTMSDALQKTGKPILFSICEWGVNKPWEWGKGVGQLWRTTEDIYQIFDSVHDEGTWNSLSVMHIADLQSNLRKYSGPGHWNDPDMLEVGNGMTYNEDKAHFALWSIMASPLIAGNDVRKMTKETIEILTNKEILAVNQDPLGIQGFRYLDKDGLQVWFKPLKNGDWAVCFVNRNTLAKTISFDWSKEKIVDEIYAHSLDKNSTYNLLDLWSKKNAGTTAKELKATIEPHGVLMYRLSKSAL
ncbi:glycoside hydrolase family 27 protein [Flavobacterium sp. Fl-318]|uniref:Alpha-galactosidase n=1 Tax=Flavobacterium cupriresistens TaxID=2893885 RepID=A0ABU4RJL3_9FLAO|nr:MULTISPECIES: glycoside hydrolase family 27 protein [unclassified Flavobacterium]MDX6191595.1 glycoside hydrolase family 27 protein [Flavobacterium sp. Fl-318]UFH41542.1 glycoside hydrolase family 27 protein [Flavobacterium sp. F-323]